MYIFLLPSSRAIQVDHDCAEITVVLGSRITVGKKLYIAPPKKKNFILMRINHMYTVRYYKSTPAVVVYMSWKKKKRIPVVNLCIVTVNLNVIGMQKRSPVLLFVFDVFLAL